MRQAVRHTVSRVPSSAALGLPVATVHEQVGAENARQVLRAVIGEDGDHL